MDAAVPGLADSARVFLPSEVLHQYHLLLPAAFGAVRAGAGFGSAAKPSVLAGAAPLGTRPRGRGLPGSRWFCQKQFLMQSEESKRAVQFSLQEEDAQD